MRCLSYSWIYRNPSQNQIDWITLFYFTYKTSVIILRIYYTAIQRRRSGSPLLFYILLYQNTGELRKSKGFVIILPCCLRWYCGDNFRIIFRISLHSKLRSTSTVQPVYRLKHALDLWRRCHATRGIVMPKRTYQGLYDPDHEHDACGVGMVADFNGRKSHEIIRNAIRVLINLEHRGACGCDPETGDGAGILIQMPH